MSSSGSCCICVQKDLCNFVGVLGHRQSDLREFVGVCPQCAFLDSIRVLGKRACFSLNAAHGSALFRYASRRCFQAAVCLQTIHCQPSWVVVVHTGAVAILAVTILSFIVSVVARSSCWSTMWHACFWGNERIDTQSHILELTGGGGA